MTISVRRIDGGNFEIVDGHARLQACLAVTGKATVTDVETHETFDVHEVDGRLVILSDGRTAVAETLAVAAIKRAARQ